MNPGDPLEAAMRLLCSASTTENLTERAVYVATARAIVEPVRALLADVDASLTAQRAELARLGVAVIAP